MTVEEFKIKYQDLIENNIITFDDSYFESWGAWDLILLETKKIKVNARVKIINDIKAMGYSVGTRLPLSNEDGQINPSFGTGVYAKKVGQMKNFKITATKNKSGNFYQHFGIHETLCSLYGDKPEDIVEIEFKISADQSVPEPNKPMLGADYWGWYSSERKEFTMMIYAQRFLLEMCFPNGIKASEEAGQGQAYRLEVVLADVKA
jgi:hypothetical protein